MTSSRPALHIASTRDIFDALDSPQVGTRLSILQAIARHPQRVLAYGPLDGRDVVDKLVTDLGRVPPGLVRHTIVRVLACFDDPRAREAVLEEMESIDDGDDLHALEGAFAQAPPAWLEERIMRADAAISPGARLAARLLASADGLGPAVRMRIAVLGAGPPPPLEGEGLKAWIAELNGPFGPAARHFLEEQPAAALALCPRWADLCDAARVWLVQHAVDADHLARLLEGDLSSAVAVAAIVRAPSLGVTVPTRFLDVEDDDVRTAAWSVCEVTNRRLAECMAQTGADDRVRIAAIRRYTASDEDAAALVALLRDDDWRVRAAASDGLIARGRGVRDLVRPLVFEEDLGPRVAAIRILWELGDEAWLEDQLA